MTDGKRKQRAKGFMAPGPADDLIKPLRDQCEEGISVLLNDMTAYGDGVEIGIAQLTERRFAIAAQRKQTFGQNALKGIVGRFWGQRAIGHITPKLHEGASRLHLFRETREKD